MLPAVVVCVAVACVCDAAALTLVESGTINKPNGDTHQIAISKVVTFTTSDSLLLSIWTEDGSHESVYSIKDGLTLTIESGVENDRYRPGFTWQRESTWADQNGNPDKDPAGGHAWTYHVLPFGRKGLGGEDPWYGDVWGRLNHFRDGRWHGGVEPGIDKTHLYHRALPSDQNRGFPLVRWSNPTDSTIRVKIEGTLTLGWHSEAKGAIQYALVHAQSRRHKTPVTWQANTDVKRVRSIFVHPTMPERAALIDEDGVHASANYGMTWQAIPRATHEALGEITSLVYSPASEDDLYIGSSSKGVWLSSGGSKPRPFASKERGLASDYIHCFYVPDHDPLHRTLLAIHGEEEAGISKSEDAGKTWQVVTSHYYVYKVLFVRTPWWNSVLMDAAPRQRPTTRSIWVSPGIGEHWMDLVRDVLPTACDVGTQDVSASYWSTSDAGLFRLRASAAGGAPEPVGPEEVDDWASVGATWGEVPRTELIYAYDPQTYGLLTSTNGLYTYETNTHGLFVGPYVREGAHVRANANGTRFFAVINGSLYIGRRRSERVGVEGVTATPKLFRYRRQGYASAEQNIYAQMRELPRDRNAAKAALRMAAHIKTREESFPEQTLTIQAHVATNNTRASSVTADLSAIGGSSAMPMFDDGTHGDQRAKDGIYASRMNLQPSNLMPDRNNRSLDITGKVPLWVTAQSGDSMVSSPAAFSVYGLPEGFVFWNEWDIPVHEAVGNVSVSNEGTSDVAYEGQHCIRLTAGPAKWHVFLGRFYQRHDITGYSALGFSLKADADTRSKIAVQLSDWPETTIAIVTPPIFLNEDRVTVTEGSPYTLCTISLGDMRKDADGFQPSQTTFVVFAGTFPDSRTVLIDDIRFFSTAQETQEFRDAWRERGSR